MKEMEALTADHVLGLLGQTALRPFESHDYAVFPGVRTRSPFIGGYKGWVVVVDGSRVEFYDTANDDVRQFIIRPYVMRSNEQ